MVRGNSIHFYLLLSVCPPSAHAVPERVWLALKNLIWGKRGTGELLSNDNPMLPKDFTCQLLYRLKKPE